MKGLGEYWRSSGKMFLSFFVVAAVLPVMLLGVMSPESFKLFTQADEATPLRIWLEPGSVVARPGDVFELRVMADYDDANMLIPKLEAVLKAGSGVKLSPASVSYVRPFVGRVEVGKVGVTVGSDLGEHVVEVVEGSVNTTLPDLSVVSVPAKINVRK